jgi:release factor glutamine methyltransferase
MNRSGCSRNWPEYEQAFQSAGCISICCQSGRADGKECVGAIASTPMDVRTALKNGIARLRDAHTPSYTLAAELLLLHVLGRDRTYLYAHPEGAISPDDEERYFALIARRMAGEPTQHLIGKQEFWGLEFEITPDVLIPRPETEHLIEVALDRLAVRELRSGRSNKNDGAGLRIADIGTGSGCIAISLAKELPAARFVVTDISAEALVIAGRNAVRHGVDNRIQFVEANLLDRTAVPDVNGELLSDRVVGSEPVFTTRLGPQLFDLIVSNPPYVGRREANTLAREVRDHEPAMALFGGEEGYELYSELIMQAAAHLKPEGIVVLELGYNSLPAVQPLFDSPDWINIGVTKDLAGIERVIAAERV